MGILAGVASFLCLLVVHEGWKKLAGLTIRKGPDGPRVTAVDPVPFTGPSAWSGGAPTTPEGETVRILACGEFVMGGPVICDYLLPDGSIILHGGASTGFSPNGRYFVTPSPSRREWPLLIYDRRRHILHTCDVDSKFWEIDLVGDMTISGRESPLVSNQSWSATIDDLIEHSTHEKMIDVADLKIPEKHWEHIRKRHEKDFPRPQGSEGPATSWRLHLPTSLRALEDPLDPLQNPRAEIVIREEESGLITPMGFPVIVWRNDSRAFVCVAKPKGGGENSWWLWDDQKGWKQLQQRQDLGANIPYGQRSKPIDLDARYLTVEWELLQPHLGEESVGELSSYTGYRLEIDGRLFEKPVIRQIIPLESSGNEDERVESAPLKNWHKLVWRFRRIDEDIHRHVYQCEFRGNLLEGEWLLDHRISRDGRYIALVAFADPPAAPHRIAILDSETGTLAWVEETFFFPEFQGFDDTHLYLVHVMERRTVPSHEVSDMEDITISGKSPEGSDGPQTALPPSDHSRMFIAHENRSRLYYRRTSVVFEDGRWKTAPPAGASLQK
ncbi:hypothetical protein [Agrobacterium sp. NPDC089420]|uniref:hypothetical protein n=1 Tax=Agrobacterium sp. NPDC089420 TaxID=3363918 RepID=UPI00385133F6